MPNQFFNNQVIPTYNSPDQKAESEKMNMLNNPLSIDAFQQYPIQSQNGEFTEGTNNQIKPTDPYGSNLTTDPILKNIGVGTGTDTGAENSYIPIGTIKDGKKWNGMQWEAIGYESTGDDTGGGTGTDNGTGTGGGYDDHIPYGTMKNGLMWNGKAWVNVNTGTDTDVVIEEDVTVDDTGGGDDTNGDDTNGDHIAPTGGTGTGTGITSWTGQQGGTGNWMNTLPQNWRDMSHQYGPDYSQSASTTSMQNPFSDIYNPMGTGQEYLVGQGIQVSDPYKQYFSDYDPARELGAKQQFGLQQESAQTGSRSGLMGLTQQQGMGGFAGGPDVGKKEMARGIRSQFGAQQEQAGLGLREDIYGMRREQEEDWWKQLARVEKSRGSQFDLVREPYIPPDVDPTLWAPTDDDIIRGQYNYQGTIYYYNQVTGMWDTTVP